MKAYAHLLVLITIFLAAAADNARAVEPLSTVELASHCEKYYEDDAEEDRVFCVRYIQGFIDGAIATDERVTFNVAREYERDESFSQRAARTRIGQRLERYGSSVYAEFCLGDPVPLEEVVERVVADTVNETLVATTPLARDLVYRTLRTHYACAETD